MHGTGLHFVRGTMAGMQAGAILGHEAAGIVEQAGPQVRNFNPGDRARADRGWDPGPAGGARLQNAETIDYNTEHPVQVIKDLTGGIGADRIIDAVGVGAQRPRTGPAAEESAQLAGQFGSEQEQVAPQTNAQDTQWVPGDAPSQALRLAVESVAKAGTIGIVGVYPPQHESFPIGAPMNRNLTIKLGNCNHRRYVPGLLSRIASGKADPTMVLTQQEDMPTVLDAYSAFDRREPGWTKVTPELSG